MRVAFYAPMKAPDDPTPSGDRMMARLLIQALEYAGHTVQVASKFSSREGAGDYTRQLRLRDVGVTTATRLIQRAETLRPELRPAVCLVRPDGTHDLIRRREVLDDLTGPERVPEWLGGAM